MKTLINYLAWTGQSENLNKYSARQKKSLKKICFTTCTF